MRKQTVLALACSALTFTCLPMAAQTPPAAGADRPMATLKVKAREVVLPVTVRGKGGELAPNLTAADFTLTEDGRPQTIKSFSRESDLPFLVGLLVDTSRSVASAMENERKAAGKFVDLMLPEDAKGAKESNKAFLIHFDREVELLEDLTAERAELHRELDGMGPTARERDSASGPETSGEDRQRPRGTPGVGTQLYDAIFLAADEMLKSKEGRKALIVFSDGQDRGSKENLNDAIDAADRANVAVYTVYFKGEPERRMSEGVPSSGRRGGGFPGGGGYPGGGYPGGGGGYPSGGGRPQGGDRGSKIDGERIMAQIATRTGGRYFVAKKKDNLEEIYSAIAEELRGQYVLTYTPDKPDNDDEFHKVVVKAKNADLIVVTREGYYSGEK